MRRSPAVLLLAVAAAAGCGGRATTTATVVGTTTPMRTVAPAPCSGSDLRASFSVVRGSAGAGQISYRLRLTNASASPCVVSGLPAGRLLDARGAALPTHVAAARRGQTSRRVVLAPGAAAAAEARFSPDVPGPGEGQVGGCEPTAATLRVRAPGGGAVDAALRPPTPVCEHGSLAFTAFSIV